MTATWEKVFTVGVKERTMISPAVPLRTPLEVEKTLKLVLENSPKRRTLIVPCHALNAN
jgi:hypothetical protein